MPRYKQIRDVSVVLVLSSILENLASIDHKRMMLISITTSQRLQGLHMLNTELMEIQNSAVAFSFYKPTKQSNPKKSIYQITLCAFIMYY